MAETQKQMIQNRIGNLQQAMKQEGLDLYFLFMCDFHGSEYIGDYFKCIRYYTDFTGSAATVLVTTEAAYLWTDGRYFLQAAEQLIGTGITLMKQGQENVPTVTEFVASYGLQCQKDEIHIGFDGRLVDSRFVRILLGRLAEKAPSKKSVLCWREDLAGSLWEQDAECPRPGRSAEPIWILDEQYAGRSAKEKIAEISDFMSEKKVDVLLLTCLDEIAYLTNLRGADVAYTPVFLSYMMIRNQKATVYLQPSCLTPETEQYLEEQGIAIRDYDSFYEDLQLLEEGLCVSYDPVSANYQLEQMLPAQVKKMPQESPVTLQKAVKNRAEMEHEVLAHRKDGVALTRFIHWLKTQVRTGMVSTTEIGAAEQLEDFRKQEEHYLYQSFAPIIAYKEHGAIVHYSADESSDCLLGNESFLLADTGGHYLEGTTDVTRTIVMGPLSDRQKQVYTAVLVGNLRLMDAKFKQGSQGANLDYLAREPLYRLGLDFNHGTGHGVGYLLNVHEGPNAFRQRPTEKSELAEGMITSDEPGYYEDGQYGIRLENLILCKKLEKTAYGQFMGFKALTMAPFDLEAVDVDQMEPKDRALLNDYHRLVYDTISPYVSEEVKAWLKHETRAI